MITFNPVFYAQENYSGGTWLTLRPYATTFKNCDFFFWAMTGYETAPMKLIHDEGYYNAKFDNVTLATNGVFAKPGETNHCGFETKEMAIKEGSEYTLIEANDFTPNQNGSVDSYTLLKNEGKTMPKNALGAIGKIEKVIMSGYALRMSENADEITFSSTVAGASRYVCTDKGWFFDTTALADIEIASYSEFQSYATNATNYRYAVLLNDITGANSAAPSNAFQINAAAGAVFNGMGHKITGGYATRGIFGSNVVSDVLLKNVTFENLFYYGYGVLGRGGTITCENVKITASDTGANAELWRNNWACLIASTPNASTANKVVLKDCSFKFTFSNTDYALPLVCNGAGAGVLTLENSTIQSNGTIAKIGEDPSRFDQDTVIDELYIMDESSRVVDKDDAPVVDPDIPESPPVDEKLSDPAGADKDWVSL